MEAQTGLNGPSGLYKRFFRHNDTKKHRNYLIGPVSKWHTFGAGPVQFPVLYNTTQCKTKQVF